VKPYVKRDKTPAADSETICEAVGRPNMQFVPVKTREQQSILVLHRVRALLVRQRTAAVTAARGMFGEFGLVVSKSIRKVDEPRERTDRSAPEPLPGEAQAAIVCLFDHINGLGERLGAVEACILAWHKARRSLISWEPRSTPTMSHRTPGLTMLSEYVPQHGPVQARVGHQALAPGVLLLSCFRRRISTIPNPGKLLFPPVEGRLGHTHFSAELLHRHAALGLPQGKRNLLVRDTVFASWHHSLLRGQSARKRRIPNGPD
jgi:hypothetical protein